MDSWSGSYFSFLKCPRRPTDWSSYHCSAPIPELLVTTFSCVHPWTLHLVPATQSSVNHQWPIMSTIAIIHNVQSLIKINSDLVYLMVLFSLPGRSHIWGNPSRAYMRVQSTTHYDTYSTTIAMPPVSRRRVLFYNQWLLIPSILIPRYFE